MEPPRFTPPPSLPARRPPVPPPALPDPPPPAPPPGPRFRWRRLIRSPRGAAGIAVLAAALLLWPFAGLSWIPWLLGFAALVLLRLLRLDGLLRGWDVPLAGLVVVVGLMASTTPWAWALALSIGVLLAGLVQLPAWRLAAVGAVLCVGSGIGFGFSLHEDREEQLRRSIEASNQNFALIGERTPQRVLGALLEGIGQGDMTAVCGLLDEAPRQQFIRAAGAADCPAAVTGFRASAGAPPRFEDLEATTVADGGVWRTDGCRTAWAGEALGGPSLGRLEIRRSDLAGGGSYFIAAFSPC